MKIYLYDRQEAIKNGCYRRIGTYERFKSISLLILTAVLILALAFLISILGILLEFWILSNLGIYILVPIAFIISVFVIPIIYSKEDNKRIVWLYRAIIKDESNKIWLVEQDNNSSYINEKDEFYKIFKNEKDGTVTELKNLKIVKESKRYYICTYQDINENDKIIEIAKAYKNLKEVL